MVVSNNQNCNLSSKVLKVLPQPLLGMDKINGEAMMVGSGVDADIGFNWWRKRDQNYKFDNLRLLEVDHLEDVDHIEIILGRHVAVTNDGVIMRCWVKFNAAMCQPNRPLKSSEPLQNYRTSSQYQKHHWLWNSSSWFHYLDVASDDRANHQTAQPPNGWSVSGWYHW